MSNPDTISNRTHQNDDSSLDDVSATTESIGLSTTPENGLSHREVTAAELGISGNDPNSNATNANVDEVKARQVSGTNPPQDVEN